MSSNQAQIDLAVYDQERFLKHTTLTAGQSLTVGRSPTAGLSIPTDPRLRDVHFSLSLDDAGRCQVKGEDLLVNEAPAEQTVLRSGDRIRAGNTVIVIDDRFHYRMIDTESGLLCAFGNHRPEDWKSVFHWLSERFDGYLLINYQAAQLPVPPEVAEQCEMLLDKIALEQRFGHSLHLVPIAMLADPIGEFDRLRKLEATVAVFSTESPDKIAEAIRQMPGWFVQSTGLAHLLTHGVPELIAPLVEPIACILRVDAGQQQIQWNAFGNRSRCPTWESFRLPNGPDVSSG